MDLKDTVLQALNELVKNGGEGSGDFDHAGRPGLVGGSEPTESRAKRGFKSKSQRKEVKKEENKGKLENPEKKEDKKETKREKENKSSKLKDVKSYYNKEYQKALKEIKEGKDYAQINYHTNIGEMKSALSFLQKHDTNWDKYDIDTNIMEYDDLSDSWNKEQIGRIAREKATQDTLKKWIAEGKDRINEYYKIYEPHKYKANNSLYKHEYIEY